MRKTFYWACKACGHAPIHATDGTRWFDSPSRAMECGKPEKCDNPYCHCLVKNRTGQGPDYIQVAPGEAIALREIGGEGQEVK